MPTYIAAGNGFDVGLDFDRATVDTQIEIDTKAYAKPGCVIGTIAGDPPSSRGFMRRDHVRVHVRKSAIVERNEAPAGYAAAEKLPQGKTRLTAKAFKAVEPISKGNESVRPMIQIGLLGAAREILRIWDAGDIGSDFDQAIECLRAVAGGSI